MDEAPDALQTAEGSVVIASLSSLRRTQSPFSSVFTPAAATGMYLFISVYLCVYVCVNLWCVCLPLLPAPDAVALLVGVDRRVSR